VQQAWALSALRPLAERAPSLVTESWARLEQGKQYPEQEKRERPQLGTYPSRPLGFQLVEAEREQIPGIVPVLTATWLPAEAGTAAGTPLQNRMEQRA
jgi:hypothetical protein